ncbi:HD family phosphohydrolase [Paenibacillus marchantiophytorum]|uniref:HD family phosphohydrolase n=1 Tax=Paenibacillus marchantiophytorum TaxID=1619310 RepID=A0ABQ2BUG7_9BACL|nr:HD-GYP domain-containing protein [Paenibacillus marchantiophytorum]GGI46117.1 HD family phosphohydrolase [Paenibacillus marchantiophytorum]
MRELLGKKLKYDVTTSYGLVLVPSQSVLTQEHLDLFQQHRIDFMDIMTTVEEEEIESESSINSSEHLVQKASQYAKDLFERIQSQKKIPLLEIKNDLIPIVQQAAENPDLYELFQAVKAKDEYTHQHNIGVGILSTLIGKWLNLDDKEVALLSLAATMHDVGKITIAEEILLKPGKLSDDEYGEMKQHTVRGYNMLRETAGIHYRVALVALQHHERADGTGYPLGLKDSQVDRMSRIVAVADVFHAMSSKRPYHEMMPFYEVVNRMREGFFGELDPHIVAVFLNNMIQNLVGRKVKLTDGRWGEVVYINPTDDTNPLVKIDDIFVDLSRERHIHIKEVVV